eukprot:1849-Heterococcus_DN1.PRE.5
MDVIYTSGGLNGVSFCEYTADDLLRICSKHSTTQGITSLSTALVQTNGVLRALTQSTDNQQVHATSVLNTECNHAICRACATVALPSNMACPQTQPTSC